MVENTLHTALKADIESIQKIKYFKEEITL